MVLAVSRANCGFTPERFRQATHEDTWVDWKSSPGRKKAEEHLSQSGAESFVFPQRCICADCAEVSKMQLSLLNICDVGWERYDSFNWFKPYDMNAASQTKWRRPSLRANDSDWLRRCYFFSSWSPLRNHTAGFAYFWPCTVWLLDLNITALHLPKHLIRF